jgi:hypothetical protein
MVFLLQRVLGKKTCTLFHRQWVVCNTIGNQSHEHRPVQPKKLKSHLYMLREILKMSQHISALVTAPATRYPGRGLAGSVPHSNSQTELPTLLLDITIPSNLVKSKLLKLTNQVYVSIKSQFTRCQYNNFWAN